MQPRAVFATVPRGPLGLGALLALGLVACGGGDAVDAGVDATAPPVRDAGRDAFVPTPDGGPDAGPPPNRELALEWVSRITSAQTLGGVAEARLAPTPDDGFVLSLTTSGAPTTFGVDGAAPRTVGDATTPVTQAGAWYDADGALLHARGVATSDGAGFAALGYAVATLADGTALFGGRFVSAGFFGGVDPARVRLDTTVEMPDDMTTWVAAEGYLAAFGTDHRITSVRTVESSRGLDDHRVVDVATLPDGTTLALGFFTGVATLGTETLTPTGGVLAGEVFLARWDASGSLAWVTRVRGASTPTRLALFPDGSSAVLLRYADSLTLGVGETNQRTLDAPPDGTLAWDAVVRFEADGSLRWARHLGSDATEYKGLGGLRTHADGSVTVAGTFRGMTAWPDAPEIDPVLIYVADGLVTRIGPDGALAWQTRIRALRSLSVQAVEPVDDGDTWVLLTVSAEGATFEPTEGPALVLPESGDNARLVILRYGADGALAGGQHLGTTDVNGEDLLRLGSGDLVLVGRYGASTVLEPGTGDERTLPSAEASRNVFVARYRRE